jgi:hypothetical protein
MKVLKKFFFISILVFIVLIILEISLRLLGFTPQSAEISKEQFFPHTPYVMDTILGYQNAPGTYKRINNEKLIWWSTNLPDQSRTCGTKDTGSSLNELAVYGCSNIYGIGLNDAQTYPWKLQEKLPNLRVKNFSTGGYNILDHYLLLKRQLDNNYRPGIVLVTFGSYYFERVVFARMWRESQYRGLKNSPYLDSIFFPRASLESDSLVVRNMKLSYFDNPLIYYSSLFNLLNKGYNNIDLYFSGAEAVSNKIADQIIDQSRTHGFRLIFLIYSNDDATQRFIKRLDNSHIEHVNGFLQNPDHRYDLYPLDAHPNELANDSISERVASYIIHSKKTSNTE